MSKSDKIEEAIDSAKNALSAMAKKELANAPNYDATLAAVNEAEKGFKRKPKIVEPEPSLLSRIGSSISAFGSYIGSSFSALGSYVGSFFKAKESVAKTTSPVNNNNAMEAANIKREQEQSAQVAELKNRMTNKNKQNTQENSTKSDTTSTTSTETYKPSWLDVLTGKAQEKVKEHGQNALELGIKAQNKTEEASKAVIEAQRNNTNQKKVLNGIR